MDQQVCADLYELEIAWARKYPERKAGGKNALSGFTYQIDLFLLSLLKNWSDAGFEDQKKPDHFATRMEALSDILTVKKGTIVFSQAKLTLRHQSIKDSIEEFFTVIDTAKTEKPNLLPTLEFKIITSKKLVKDAESLISKYLDENVAHKAALSGKIKVEMDQSPTTELLALLVNKFHANDAFDYIQKWRGQIVGLANKQLTFDYAANAIWSDLQKFRSAGPSADFHLWNDDDKPPTHVYQGPVLTGQRPRVRYLREGYFFERISVYNNLLDNFKKVVDSFANTKRNLSKIPCFWIGGRSGCGKSVSLLFLLNAIYEEFGMPILYFGNSVNGLGEATKFVNLNRPVKSQTIIAFDDPYFPASSQDSKYLWKTELNKIINMRDEALIPEMPLLIFCGPTEYGRKFKDLYYEELHIEFVDLPDIDDFETKHLSEWHEKRTGKKQSLSYENNMLMVQLLFSLESQGTPLKEFSFRLMDRLKIMGEVLFSTCSKILALNRLYLGYSSKAVTELLNPEEKNQLTQLETEFHFGEKTTQTGRDYWLLHPHLANSIFNSWNEGNPLKPKEYLLDAIRDVLRFGRDPSERTAPVWAICDSIMEQNFDRFSHTDLNYVANQVLTDICESSKARENLYLLPLVIELTAVLKKPESSIAFSIDSLSNTHPNDIGFRLSLHKLLQHFNTFSVEFQTRIIRLVHKTLSEHIYWKDWKYLFMNLMVWDESTATKALFLTHLTTSTDICDSMDQKAMKWLNDKHFADTISKQFKQGNGRLRHHKVVNELITSKMLDLDSYFLEWANTNCSAPTSVFTIGNLIASSTAAESIEIGMKWLEKNSFTKVANFIIEPILKRKLVNERLLEFTFNWLSTEYGDASYILENLCETYRGLRKREIAVRVEKWLAENFDSNGWYYVWKSARDFRTLEKSTLDDLGILWLTATIDASPQMWAGVCEIVLRDSLEKQRILELGRRFIHAQKFAEKSFAKILPALLRNFPNDRILEDTAINLLKKTDVKNRHWKSNYDICTPCSSGSETIQFCAENYLAAMTDDPEWGLVFVTQLKKMDNRPSSNMIRLALIWLRQKKFSDRHWFPIWRTVFNERASAGTVGLGITWLDHITDRHSGYPKILLLILSRSTDQSVVELAVKWLMTVPMDGSQPWDAILIKVLQSRVKFPEIPMLVNTRIGAKELSRSNWPRIYLLARKNLGWSKLTGLAADWLLKNSVQSAYWDEVYLDVFDQLRPNSQAFEKGLFYLKHRKSFNPDRFKLILEKIERKSVLPVDLKAELLARI